MIMCHPYRRIAAGLACVAMLSTSTAFPHSLTVPFFRDDGGTMAGGGPVSGSAGVISVRNTRDTPITIYLVYAQNDVDGGTLLQQAVPYTLGAREGVQWRPVKTDAAEGTGLQVPNMLSGLGNFGSVVIYWTGGDEMAGALAGRYVEFSSGTAMMHVLAEL